MLTKITRKGPFILTLALAACGPLVSNTDKPTGPYLAGAAQVTGNFNVSVSENAPRNGGATLTGVSCKNKLWEPAPTNEAAIAVLKREASNAGYDTVFIESVRPDPNALMKNCWSAIIATGQAFNS